MNILFLLKGVGVGGVEVVTSTLANKFVCEGHNVAIFAREKRENNIVDRFDERIKLYYGVGDNACEENVRLLHSVYEKENIEIVVNQWGLPFIPIKLARKAEQGHRVKIISFHHNDPSTNGKLKDVDIAFESSNGFIKRMLLHAKGVMYNYITSKSMRYTYNHSDRFMVLSNSYLEHLQKFIGVGAEEEQGVLTNPVTIDSSDFNYSIEKKRKEIIFCGRIDYNQKRVCRVIDSWALLENKYPDWQLTIVGDGPSRVEVESQAKGLGLTRVQFEGFQQPLEYYKRASMLILTSEYEGFPLVLAECMSFGVVPVVYGSFSAVYDIISDNEDGLIVPYEITGFKAKKMAEKMSSIMLNQDKLNKLQLAAIEKSKNYSIDKIYQEWEKVFESLFN